MYIKQQPSKPDRTQLPWTVNDWAWIAILYEVFGTFLRWFGLVWWQLRKRTSFHRSPGGSGQKWRWRTEGDGLARVTSAVNDWTVSDVVHSRTAAVWSSKIQVLGGGWWRKTHRGPPNLKKKNGNERDTAATSFRRTKWRSCLIGWSHRLGVVMDGLSVAKWTMFWSIWAVDQLAPVIHMVWSLPRLAQVFDLCCSWHWPIPTSPARSEFPILQGPVVGWLMVEAA